MTVITEETTTTTTTAAGFTLPVSVLRDGLTGALVAVGRDDMLPALTAVRIEFDGGNGGQVRFVSTDRYRLAIGRTTAVTGIGSGVVMLPRKSAEALLKALPKPTTRHGATSQAKATVTVTNEAMSVTVAGIDDGISVEYRMLDAAFPKWDKLMPTEFASVEHIAFNVGYMADVAKIPHDKKLHVSWNFVDRSKPAVATFPTFNGIDWSYLLMPVRV